MWRRLLRRVHPDHGGDSELFVWARALFEYVAGDEVEDVRSPVERREPPRHYESSSSGDRIDFNRAYEVAGSFDDLTMRAVEMSVSLGEPFASLLRLLEDCSESDEISLSRQQQQGATYRTVAAIAYAAGMSASERMQWYRVAERIPLSQRHCGHILSRLKRGEAA